MNDLTDEQRGWLAGLLEGEGCFTVKRSAARRDGTRRYYPTILTKQARDPEILVRAQQLTGVGSVSGPHHSGRPQDSPTWQWCVQAGQAVDAVVCSVLHLLSRRRLEQSNRMYAQCKL